MILLGTSRSRSLVVVFALMMSAQGVAAQEPSSPSRNTSSPEQSAPQVSEKLPKIIYTRDQDGELIPWVESFPWEELAQQDGGSRANSFAVTELHLDVEAEADSARVSNEIHLRIFEDGQVVVPISMGEVHFLSQPRITRTLDSDVATAHVFARFNEQHDEYELVIRGAKDQLLAIQFDTQVVLRRIGDQTLLRMSLPRVPLSNLQLAIPSQDLDVGVADGMTVRTKSSAISSAETPVSHFEIDGLLPEFQVWWQPGRTVDVGESFYVDGDIEVTVDELGAIRSSATLEVSSFNDPIKGVTVQLPVGARWSHSSETYSAEDYLVSKAERINGREALHIAFVEPSTEPTAVRLEVEAEGRTDAERIELEIAGFDVLGAASQSGNIRVFSEGSWMLSFKLGNFARQTGANIEGAEKTFEYSRVDQISMVVTKQSSQLIVEPIYIVDLEESVASLTAIFRCTRRGARRGVLSIDLDAWIFQSLGPDPNNVTIDTPELLSPTNGQLDIPVTVAADRFEVVVRATLPIEQGLVDRATASGDVSTPSRFVLRFPKPLEADRLLQSTVALTKAETIALNVVAPEYTEISLPDRLRSELPPDTRPLCFRMRAAGEPVSLPIMAGRIARSRFVTIDTDIVDINQDRIRIRQKMRWQVKGVPLTSAQLVVNEGILEFGDLEVQLNGQPIVYNELPNFRDASTAEATVQVPIELYRVGVFELTVTYNWSTWFADGHRDTLRDMDVLDVDLVLPAVPADTREETLSIRHGVHRPRIAGYKVSLDPTRYLDTNGAWSVAPNDPDLLALSEESHHTLPIAIQEVTSESETSQFDELVDRAWFQTWLTARERTDRAVFRVFGGTDELQVVVPESVGTSLTIWVDGKVSEFRQSENRITIPVDPSKPSHVVELHYSGRREPVGVLETSLPRIADADIMGQWYWHIVMPRNECMVTWPGNLTRAHHWEWSTIAPRREAEMSLAELEEWSGAITSGGVVLAGSSQYLFGGMGEPEERLVVRTMPLPIYVLAMAGAVLVAGLVLVYTKRPALVLVVLGATILGLIFLNPTYASMAGQIAAIGIVLVVIGQLLLWLLHHSPPPRLLATSTRGRTAGTSFDLKSESGTTSRTGEGSSRLRRA